MATVNYYYCFPSTATAAAESLHLLPRTRGGGGGAAATNFTASQHASEAKPPLPTPRLPRLVWFLCRRRRETRGEIRWLF